MIRHQSDVFSFFGAGEGSYAEHIVCPESFNIIIMASILPPICDYSRQSSNRSRQCKHLFQSITRTRKGRQGIEISQFFWSLLYILQSRLTWLHNSMQASSAMMTTTERKTSKGNGLQFRFDFFCFGTFHIASTIQ